MLMNDLMKLNPGKRVLALKQLHQKQKKEMREKLPILDREEIIRYRLPPHKALIRAIDQDGYKNTAEYIRQLIDYQEYIRNFYGPDSNIWLRPRLINTLTILSHLREGLSKAEKSHMNDNIGGEIAEILKLAVEYGFGEENWWWLGHQLLDQAITISSDYTKDGGMHHAIARYAIGKFLLEIILDVEAALEHLNIARSMSVGTSWNAKGIFPSYQQSVFTEVSILLYRVILKQAKKCMKNDPHQAIKLCEMARRAALDGCDHSGETEAYIMKGECEQLIFDTKSAIISFQKALAIQSVQHEVPKWKCEALSHLGVAYLKHGSLPSALKMLHLLKNYASDHKLTYYVAISYKYLGEYYLREGTPRNSTPLLKVALKLFNDGNFIKEAEGSRNYAAISIGIELMNSYIQLIVDCVDTNENYESLITKLIEWKDSRSTFWIDAKGEISFINLDDVREEKEQDFITPRFSDTSLNKELVISVVSLVDSNDTFKDNNEKRTNKLQKSMEKMKKFQGNDKKETFTAEKDAPKDVEKQITEEGDPKNTDKELITLHIADNFDDD